MLRSSFGRGLADGFDLATCGFGSTGAAFADGGTGEGGAGFATGGTGNVGGGTGNAAVRVAIDSADGPGRFDPPAICHTIGYRAVFTPMATAISNNEASVAVVLGTVFVLFRSGGQRRNHTPR
jgi:hypothetical protein